MLTDATKELAPWSMSKAKCALECPFQFHMRYGKIKQPGVRSESDSIMRIGTACHTALEYFLGGKPIQTALLAGANKSKLTSVETEVLTSMAHNMRGFKTRMEAFKQTNNVQEMLLEKQFAFNNEFAATTFWDGKPLMRGMWDVGLVMKDAVVIIDHKTGENADPAEIATKHGDQAKIYSVSAYILYPHIKGVQSAFHFVQTEEILWGKFIPTADIKNIYMPWVVEHLNAAGAAAQTQNPKPGKHCVYCQHTHVCPESPLKNGKRS